MITWLDVRNFILVKHVSLNFQTGMTVLTGETGAGKSIIVDALAILLGDRTSGKIIRQIRNLWPHLLIGGASLTVEEAENQINSGYLDLVTWARAILANPDFVKLIKNNLPIKPFNDKMRDTLI